MSVAWGTCMSCHRRGLIEDDGYCGRCGSEESEESEEVCGETYDHILEGEEQDGILIEVCRRCGAELITDVASEAGPDA